jgi:Cu+-exporting ATPase
MATTTSSASHVQLEIGGMTCASCAARVEKRLNKLDGVSATVNYATEKATVDAPPGISTGDLIAQVKAAGYTARLPDRPAATDEGAAAGPPDPTRALRDRLVTSAVLALPVVLLAMVPALQFDAWQWLSLSVAAPVVTWGAWPFHRAAWTNLRHGTATMDTLISVGTLAAFGWSLYALFLGDAGDRPCVTASRSPPSGAWAPARSTWRWPPVSPCSSSPAGTSRPGPSAAPVPPCAPCSSWAPRTSPS